MDFKGRIQDLFESNTRAHAIIMQNDMLKNYSINQLFLLDVLHVQVITNEILEQKTKNLEKQNQYVNNSMNKHISDFKIKF